jgi:hypothetical protein
MRSFGRSSRRRAISQIEPRVGISLRRSSACGSATIQCARLVACGSRAHPVDGVQTRAKREAAVATLRGTEMIAKVMTGIDFEKAVEVPKKDRQKIASGSNRRIQLITISRFGLPQYKSVLRPVRAPRIEFKIDWGFGNAHVSATVPRSRRR